MYKSPKAPAMPRGLRNNNPGNIRLSTTKWQGQVSPGADPAFVTFSSIAYGYRALMRVLLTYMQTHDLVTISGIIKRWAPMSENDTPAYIARVSGLTGYPADYTLTPTRDVLTALAGAISAVENGRPAVPEEVQAGYDLLVTT